MLDFMCIGAQKAGTSWLHHHLDQLPGVAFPYGKEAHFWDHRQPPVPADEVARYLAPFNARAETCNGDMTPAYAILPTPLIEQIQAVNPALKLVYLVRNPLDRAWSSALMALDRAQMLFEEASDQWFLDHFQSRASRMRGDYVSCIDRWRRVFPTEQLLILQYEQIDSAPQDLLRQVGHHLEIDVTPIMHAAPDVYRRRIFAGSGEPLRPSLRPVLETLYREQIEALKRLHGIDYTDAFAGTDG